MEGVVVSGLLNLAHYFLLCMCLTVCSFLTSGNRFYWPSLTCIYSCFALFGELALARTLNPLWQICLSQQARCRLVWLQNDHKNTSYRNNGGWTGSTCLAPRCRWYSGSESLSRSQHCTDTRPCRGCCWWCNLPSSPFHHADFRN